MELARRLLYLPPAASTFADDVDRLHASVIGSALVVFAGIVVYTIYAIVRGPRLRARVASPLTEGGLIAGVLGVFLAWWVVGYRLYLRLETPPDGAMVVWVTAKQWMWTFTYADGASSVGTLVVPAGRAVKLVFASRDVIHSFFVPAFRVKQDVVPGRATTVWFQTTGAGSWPIRCAEFCGMSHSGMLGQVVAVDGEAWDAWAARTRDRVSLGDTLDLVAEGERVAAEKGCLACHTVTGASHIGPTWKGDFGTTRALADGTTVRVDEAYLTESMMDPLAKVAAGFDPVMPTFRGQLDPGETAALVEYIRSLAGGP